MKKIILFFITSIGCFGENQYYATAADENFYTGVIQLIGSIHKNNFDSLGMIFVFDLGLNKKQKIELGKIKKVQIMEVEKNNPRILEPILTSPNGRRPKGLFSWKPTIFKQILDLVPHVVYCDSSVRILKNLDSFLEYCQNQGYFLITCGSASEKHNIVDRLTNNLKTYIHDNLDYETQQRIYNPNTEMIWAGLQFISRKVYDAYVIPCYEIAKNIEYFKDDGSSKLGYGQARHDQTIFSIFAQKNNFNLYRLSNDVEINKQKINIKYYQKEINSNTIISTNVSERFDRYIKRVPSK